MLKKLLEYFVSYRQSWLCSCVGLLGSMVGAVHLTKTQLVSFLRVWSYCCMKTFHRGVNFVSFLNFAFSSVIMVFHPLNFHTFSPLLV